MRKVAAVDIGSNTTRLLIAAVGADGRLAWLHRRVTVTGLGWGLDAEGRLGAGGMEKTVAALRSYAAEIGKWDVDGLGVVATEATREAENRDDLLQQAAQVLGVRPAVITGDQEAWLSFAGVTSDLDAEPPFLVIDPGGGSTEFVLGDELPFYTVSTRMGSVRLTERSLPDHPASGSQVEAARNEARRAFAEVELPASVGTVVGVGGTFTALAAIVADLPQYVPEQVHLSTVTAADLDDVVARLAGMSVGETAAIPSLDPDRAPVLLGGAIVAREALRRAGDMPALVSENDILAGVALHAASA